MLIVWIRKANQPNRETESQQEQTARHNREMKQFRSSHPDLDVVDARDIVTADGTLLAPASGVKLDPYICN